MNDNNPHDAPASSFLLMGLIPFLVAVAFGLHAIACLLWWWTSPGGFPFDHARFWANRVVPVGFAAVALTGCIAAQRRHDALARTGACAFAATWLAGSVAARTLFPVSFERRWLLGLVCALGWIAAIWLLPRTKPASKLLLGLLVSVAACGAIAMAWAQRAPLAATRPLNDQPEIPDRTPQNANRPVQWSPNSWLTLSPGGNTADIRHDTYHVHIRPVLEFSSTSPDRCWTILRPRRYELPWNDRRVTEFFSGETDSEVWCQYSEGSALHCRVDPSAPSAELTAWIPLPADVYSHLNSFAELTISGAPQLLLSFSPAPRERIEVLPADYPVGRPARFACLHPGGRFVVYEASTGEKGPFTELASGEMERHDPLTITLWDGPHPLCALTFDDWAAQCDTSLSPTAGWGIPANAIEFETEEESDGRATSARLSLTLAGTGIGRGWDSIGHRAGTYRNRMHIRLFPQSSE